ncbi:MAG: sugar fermentation stimulation protein A [Glaciecola sp.]
MIFPSALVKGKLIKRYKRFLADVKLNDGEVITVHCPNTGAMTNCATPGWTVYLSLAENKKRKYAHTWELAVNDFGEWIGINANNANKIVKEALQTSAIVELAEYNQIRSEFKVGESRIDFFLQGDGMPDCYLEVKSMTLCENNIGYFPDTVTQRGTKHANELAQLAKDGHRAVLLFCAQHSGIEKFNIAKHIDEEYALAVLEAQKSGLEVICYGCNFSCDFIELAHSVKLLSK